MCITTSGGGWLHDDCRLAISVNGVHKSLISSVGVYACNQFGFYVNFLAWKLKILKCWWVLCSTCIVVWCGVNIGNSGMTLFIVTTSEIMSSGPSFMITFVANTTRVINRFRYITVLHCCCDMSIAFELNFHVIIKMFHFVLWAAIFVLFLFVFFARILNKIKSFVLEVDCLER